MYQRPPDPRLWRLFDLAEHEEVEVVCMCGYRRMCFGRGLMQRLYRVPSDTLLYDLQYRLRCRHCNARRDFRITVRDTRPHTDKQFVGDPPVVIVE